jgi:DNA-3-methyladenine glycosylase I
MSGCDWSGCHPLLIEYHEREWGVPLFDDRTHFEFLMMEALQCGLSWTIVMKKRQIFRLCFDNFDSEAVAAYGEDDVQRIINTEGMLRSLPKIRAVIGNAACFNRIRQEFGSFSDYIWSFTDRKAVLYEGHGEGRVPVSNGLSDRISKDLKRRGFKFLGTVTVYSYLQSCGIINDHGSECGCYKRIVSSFPTVELPADNEKF